MRFVLLLMKRDLILKFYYLKIQKWKRHEANQEPISKPLSLSILEQNKNTRKKHKMFIKKRRKMLFNCM